MTTNCNMAPLDITMIVTMIDLDKIMAKASSRVTPHLSVPDCLRIEYHDIRKDCYAILTTLAQAQRAGVCKFVTEDDMLLAAMAIDVFSRTSAAPQAQRVVFSIRAHAIVELERHDPERAIDLVPCIYVDAAAVNRAVNWRFFVSVSSIVLPMIILSVILTVAGLHVACGNKKIFFCY